MQIFLHFAEKKNLSGASPGLVAAKEAVFVQRTAENQITVLGIDLAVVELAGFGIKDFAAVQTVVLFVVLHSANDDQSDNGRIMVIPFTRLAAQVGTVHEHFLYLAVEKSIGTLINRHDRSYFTGLVIHRLPVTKDSR